MGGKAFNSGLEMKLFGRCLVREIPIPGEKNR